MNGDIAQVSPQYESEVEHILIIRRHVQDPLLLSVSLTGKGKITKQQGNDEDADRFQ